MRDSRQVDLSDRRILYEDSALLAVDKPSGLVVHATVDPLRDHLVAALSRWLRARDRAVGHLRLVHRLDRDTSGVILLSRDPAVDGELTRAFAERRVDKIYWAIVHAHGSEFPTGPSELRSYLAPGRGPKGRTAVVRAGGQPARTTVRLLSADSSTALVEARPHTGRTHQIRVHLAELGFPILGDELYGLADPRVKRLMLHAARIELAHPRTGDPLVIEAPTPRAFRARFADPRVTEN